MKRKPELGKYLLWAHFHRHREVARYLPATARYTHDSFRRFLNQYGMIYVKPSGGSMGRGVMKVWKQQNHIFVHKTVYAPRKFASVLAALQFVDAQREGKACIVQQGLWLARHKDRPFDIRVMMQRDVPGGRWLYSGMVAKLAGSGSAVTNVALSRGSVAPVKRVLKESLHLSDAAAERKIGELKRICLIAANHFDSYQPYRELGFDMAVDRTGRIWMIEQNTAPSHPLFRRLTEDLSMYRRIQYRWGRYARSLRGGRR